jgi:hypothetical protein
MDLPHGRLDLAPTEKVTMASDLFMRRHGRIRGHAKTVAHLLRFGGRISFQMSSYVIVAPSTPVAFDLMPDNLPPGRIQ